VLQIPTVLLSSHKGFAHVSGAPMATARIEEMVDALGRNGWLTGLDAVLIGYLPTRAHVDAACRVAETCRAASPPLRLVVDPVIGDWPKGLYQPEPVAAAIRDRLAPIADILTPNRFEAAWLSGETIETLADAVDAARRWTGRRGGGRVLLTSAPLGEETTGVLDIAPGATRVYRTPRLDAVPNGPGDVFAALIAAGLGTGAALGHLQAILTASAGRTHLRLSAPDADWTTAAAIPSEPIASALPDDTAR
jgi:pyridoxine kinase